MLRAHGAFADLNLPLPADTDALVHRERVALALRLGYSHVATAHVVDAATLADSDRCQLRPVEAAALHNAAPADAEVPQPLLLREDAGNGALVQLTRLTVVADDPAQCARLAAAADVTRSYDLLAVQPTSERAFVSACTTLDVDLISFDLTRRLPFRRDAKALHLAHQTSLTCPLRLRTPTVRAALARGVAFEVCYAPALREPAARRQLFANALAVVRATGGLGVVLSSGALRAFELRGPYDVANLGTLFGLPLAAAKEAVSARMAAVLHHAHARRNGGVGRLVTPLAAPLQRRTAHADDAHAWPLQHAATPAAAAAAAPDDRRQSSLVDDSGFLAF